VRRERAGDERNPKISSEDASVQDVARIASANDVHRCGERSIRASTSAGFTARASWRGVDRTRRACDARE